jgi:nucleoside-diphosphate-sugar epimerase
LRAASGVPLSEGTQVRDFVYVGDAAEACMKAGDDMTSSSHASTATWNVCTGVGNSVRAFASLVAQAMGERPELLGFGDLPMRPDDEPFLVGDGEQMSRALGWRPRHDLAAGIRTAVAALMKNRRVAV